jgi:hypothetical protein
MVLFPSGALFIYRSNEGTMSEKHAVNGVLLLVCLNSVVIMLSNPIPHPPDYTKVTYFPSSNGKELHTASSMNRYSPTLLPPLSKMHLPIIQLGTAAATISTGTSAMHGVATLCHTTTEEYFKCMPGGLLRKHGMDLALKR